MYDEWMEIAIKILDESFVDGEVTCPECGKNHIDYRFVANLKKNTGYLSIWCNSCLNGIQVSRVKVPDISRKVDMYDDESLKKEIPNFKLVHPKSN